MAKRAEDRYTRRVVETQRGDKDGKRRGGAGHLAKGRLRHRHDHGLQLLQPPPTHPPHDNNYEMRRSMRPG
jgi:hypothetical protein